MQTIETRKTYGVLYIEVLQKKLPWLLIFLWLGVKIIGYFIPQLYYTQKSQESSPNGQYTVFAFRSASETGHAPYGYYLVISKRDKVYNPENEMVIFAGYCKNSPEYSWVYNANVEVVCESTESDSILTLSRKAFGITINTKIISDNKLP